jgi:hypothetical protein
MTLHSELKDSTLDTLALEYALKGYYNMKSEALLKNSDVITVIDFNKPSNEERMWVIDLTNSCVLFRKLVSHGMNSGTLFAQKFSNVNGSHQSSLGFYVTADAFMDKKLDYCLRLSGKEFSNSNAWSRGIIIHKSWYVEPDFLVKNGNILGRSHGCPALPEQDYNELVNAIANGSCLFIYHKTYSYLRWSRYINNRDYLSAPLDDLVRK